MYIGTDDPFAPMPHLCVWLGNVHLSALFCVMEVFVCLRGQRLVF